ncbi:helix-turn-helix transcriptional regulator [Microbacteriaceae bacterium VKM Ac-2854]|nr:helix-turn-helix transcriptional regulator [Microbacteriaceae bacterium VKM Ac-2854]
MADVFRAIADETRRALLDVLLQRDEQTLFEVCSKLAMEHDLTPTRQAVSQHLDVLEQAGLVRTERRGRYKLHTIDTTPLSQITERWPLREAKT